DRRVLDQALDAAEALGEREEPAALEEPPGALQPALEHGRHHPAVAPVHLPFRQGVLGMARQAGVKDPFDFRMLFEPSGDVDRILAMPLHSEREGLDAAQREKGIERARYA